MSAPFTVGVLGAGHVGAAVTNALVLLGACRRVVLFDRQLHRAEGEAWDIEDGVPLLEEVEIIPTSSYADLATADVVVITVGQAEMRENRLELLGTNAGIIIEVIDQLDEVAPNAVLIMATNPVDVLTRVAMDRSIRPSNLILGTGTLGETARLSHRLGGVLEVAQGDVHAYVIGEHGQSAFPVWSSAEVGSVKLDDLPLPSGDPVSTCGTNWRSTSSPGHSRSSSARGTPAKGWPWRWPASSVARRDQKQVLVISSRPRPEYGIGDVVLGLPCVVGRSGIERQLLLSLAADEQERLRQSAASLDEAYRSVAG